MYFILHSPERYLSYKIFQDKQLEGYHLISHTTAFLYHSWQNKSGWQGRLWKTNQITLGCWFQLCQIRNVDL